MNFPNMLIMVGPAGKECPYSIKKADQKTGEVTIPNNHWCKSSSGIYIARGAEYTLDTDIYSGTIPRLLTISGGSVAELEVTDALMMDSFSVVDVQEVQEALS